MQGSGHSKLGRYFMGLDHEEVWTWGGEGAGFWVPSEG